MRHSRREFIGAAILGVAAAAPTRLLAAFDPLEKNIRELQRAMTLSLPAAPPPGAR